MSDICSGAMYTCGDKRQAITSGNEQVSLNRSETRTITLDVNGNIITLQSRERTLAYAKTSSYSLSNFKWVAAFNLYEVSYMPCYSTNSTSDNSFSDSYKTLDTELSYLDLRNNVLVIKQISDSLLMNDANKEDTPSDTVSVFTGYVNAYLNPYIWTSVPIERTTEYALYINGEKTVLTTEDINRGYPDVNLLLPSISIGRGLNFNEVWASEIDWYINGNHKEEDGDEYLFWPPWLRACGDLDQALDSFNRDLVYRLYNGEYSISNNEGFTPQIKTSRSFKGSIAFDRNKNMFYSIATPNSFTLTNPTYEIKNKLLVQNIDVTTQLPKEKVYNTETEQTTEMEHDAWYPIAPI